MMMRLSQLAVQTAAALTLLISIQDARVGAFTSTSILQPGHRGVSQYGPEGARSLAGRASTRTRERSSKVFSVSSENN